MEDEPPPTQKSSGKGHNDWAKQLEKSFSSAGSGAPNRSSARDSNPMVKIVGYDAPAQPSRRSSHTGSESARQSYAPSRSDSHGGYGGTLNYNNISGTRWAKPAIVMLSGNAFAPCRLRNRKQTICEYLQGLPE